MSPPHERRAGLCERWSYAVVRIASQIAPGSRRKDFRQEWLGELAYRFRPPQEAKTARPPTRLGRCLLLYRAILSLGDALSLRLNEVPMDGLFKDLVYAFRVLLRKPGFTALALVTIGLGIGANTAIFTVVNAVLLRPLPYPEPDQLALVWETAVERGWDRASVSAEDYLTWRSEAKSFEALAAVAQTSFSLTGEGEPERIAGMRVMADFFNVFRVAPALGAPFDARSNQQGAHRQVVLSHGLWERRYGADPAIVGTAIHVDGEAFDVVAVMPEGFQFPSAAEMWAPLVFNEAQLQDRNWHFLLVVGRLTDGTTLEGARAEMVGLASRIAGEFPDSNEGWGATVHPLHNEMTRATRTALVVLLCAVAFVLLIACANVANLLLVRASSRVQEMSVRAAMGASKGQLARQLLTESILLSALGGILGLGLAYVSLDLLVGLGPVTVPGGGEIAIDGKVLFITAGGALLTGVLFGLAPAASVWGTLPQWALRAGSRGQAGGPRNRLRSTLVVIEMALALVLISGAGLMLRSVQQLVSVDVGIDTENLLLTQFSLPPAAYPTPESQVQFYDQLMDRAAAIPGVKRAALNPWMPPGGGPQTHVRIEGVHDTWTMDLPVGHLRTVSPGYFETMGIELLKGRTFTEQDNASAPAVVVIDEAFAEAHFPGEDPIGKRMFTLDDTPREIIGVVANVANTGLTNDPGPSDYLPYTQAQFGQSQTIILRTQGDPHLAVPSLREALAELDPNLPLYGIETMEERLSTSTAQPRFNMTLLMIFAGLALLLAGIGIYGVMAFVVTERTREIGLRMALGATGSSVLTLVLRRALILTVVGIVVGIAAAAALNQAIASLLFGIDPLDPPVLLVVSGILLLVASVASIIPALRASRMDPLQALHTE